MDPWAGMHFQVRKRNAKLKKSLKGPCDQNINSYLFFGFQNYVN